MEPIPLIPKSTIKSNHDISHVIQETFQESFGKRDYPENIMKNLTKFNIESQDLKGTAECTQNIINKYNEKSDLITETERELMENHGIYLIGKEILNQDKLLTETLKLKRYSLLPDVSAFNQSGLIKQQSLLPNPVERAMDFQLNSNRHHCVTQCLCDSSVDIIKKAPKSRKQKPPSRKDLDVIFVANPTLISFFDYKLNVNYKRTLKIRNMTTKGRSITIKTLPKSNEFRISAETSPRVAPGMCAVYTVEYKTAIYKDLNESVKFNTFTGKDVTIKLQSWSNSPNLRIYVLKNTCNLTRDKNSTLCLSQSDFDIERTMALNSSIDCGCTLIGFEVKISLIIKNDGGLGKFFFLNEADWYHYSIFNINSSMELVSDAFKLYPVYFVVDTEEFVEIMINFYPKRYGLFAEMVYLLCNNNTCEELDFIGDGIYFEKNFITFHLKQKDADPFFLDIDSDYCLHVGKTLTCQTVKAQLKISNISPINLNYYWSIRKSSNPTVSDFKHLAFHWITIEDDTKSIPYYSSKEFSIRVQPETTVEGLYRVVLCLYIENIPEISLKDHQNFNVIERNDSKEDLKVLDVLVGEVELLLEIEPIGIIIEPNPIVVPNFKHTETILVLSQTCYNLQCQWKRHKSNRFTSIEPKVFELYDKMECTILINADGEFNDIEEQFLLSVDGGYKQQLRVLLTADAPKVAFDRPILNFGDLMINFSYEKCLFVENLSAESVFWEVYEENDFQNVIYPTEGVLKPYGKSQINFAPNTKVLGEFQSFLKLTTNFSHSNDFDSICNVTYNITQPDLLIHTNTSEFPILCPEDILFVGKPTQMHICIHNVGKVIAIFFFGTPTGGCVNDFEINLNPIVGIIKNGENIHVDVTIIPKSMGFYQDIYLPLFVLGLNKIILIRLMCLVGDVTVNIYLPYGNNDYSCILWPKIAIEEYPDVYVAEGPPDDIIKFQDFVEPECESYGGNFNEKISLPSFNPEEESIKYDYFNLLDGAPTTTEFSSSSETTTTTTYSTTTKTIKDRVLELFKGKANLQKYYIEFQAVPLRTPVKQTIKIENLTPGEGLVYMEAINFYPEFERMKNLNDVLAELKLAKSTVWDEIVTPEGIVVKIENQSKNLNSFEIIEFDVWVYATTWGYYLEEIVVDISEVLPFTFSVLIEVLGLPIEYPIGLNSIRKEPILRLGTLSYKSDDIQRRVKIVNTSVCAITITWNVFMKVEKKMKSISIALDLPLSDDLEGGCESKPKLVIFDQYLGKLNIKQFSVEPRVSTIPPHSFVYVTVTTNVNNFDEMYLDQSIHAHLVGIIKIPCEQRLHENLFVRPHGDELLPTKLKITLQISLPTIILDGFDDQKPIKMTTFASDVLHNEQFSTTRRLLLKNTSKSQALVYLDVDKPFKVEKIIAPNIISKTFKGTIPLHPEDTMEVFLSCFLCKRDILELVESLKLGSKGSDFSNIDYEENSLTISKDLFVFQRENLDKTIPLELKIFFPIFKAKPIHIQFGNVYIGNTAKQIVCIRNLTISPLSFNVYKTSKYPEFIIQPTNGILKPLTSGEEFVLSIFFTPTEPQTYLLWFAIETTLPHHFAVINVVGVGTYDENYYKPGLH
ncbi:deleted in lung and esophageal cancer protein 1-like isoform X1 [Onthophagus taurus]|uniref:deleted in lung and esophageal cancer protein 1-like isoform X1 n=1 Tax=Onthophagus taurus TaxID=166361 RepID=UPI0039BE6710